MTATVHGTAKPVRLPGEVSVVNAGLPLFAEAIAEQGRPVVQLDWRIPGGGDPAVVAALRRLSGPKTAVIDAANAEVCRRLDRGAPPRWWSPTWPSDAASTGNGCSTKRAAAAPPCVPQKTTLSTWPRHYWPK